MSCPRPFEAGLFAGGQPSPSDLAVLAAAGVRTVINLRASTEAIGYEEAQEVERLGMRYVTFPVAGPQDVTCAAAARFARELDRARSDGPVFIHCASGNRVGALVALDRGLIRGQSLEEALCAGRAAGLTTLQPHVTGLLERTPADP